MANSPALAAADSAVQRTSVEVGGGKFVVDEGEPDTAYVAVNQLTDERKNRWEVGSMFKVRFYPKDSVQNPTVSLVQTVQDDVRIVDKETQAAVAPKQHNKGFGAAAVAAGPRAGLTIDQDFYDAGDKLVNLDPRYAQQRLGADAKMVTQDPKQDQAKRTPGISGEVAGVPSAGWAADRLKDRDKKQPGFWGHPAALRDRPTVEYSPDTHTVTGAMRFEVAALADKKFHHATRFLGSVGWGWRMLDGAPALEPAEMTKRSDGAASEAFLEAAAAWNAATIEDQPTLQLPTE